MIDQTKPAPPRGTRVVDLDGRHGTIILVTEWEGSRWYDVRFGPQGAAVRYDRDLTIVEPRPIRCNWCGKDHPQPAQNALEALARCCKVPSAPQG